MSPTQVRVQLIRNGWAPLPIKKHDGQSRNRGKAPGPEEWQRFAAFEADLPTRSDLAAWQRRERDWPGTGIGCGTVVAIDVDFGSDPQLASQVRIMAFEVFGETPFERQGASPKTCFVYRAAEPTPSLHLKAADGSGDGLDVLSEGTQLVAHGVHPGTLRPYVWIGTESPLTSGPDAAPEITRAQVDEFIRRVRGVIELSTTGGRAGRRGGTSDQIVRDAAGIVIDGRETHLYRTVYSVARAMRAEGLDLDADTLARRAWDRFADTAKTDDGRWGEVDAEIKAKAIIAKWRSGRLDLDADEPDNERVEPTWLDQRRPLPEAEQATRNTISAFFGHHVPAWRAELAAWKQATRAFEEAQGAQLAAKTEARMKAPYDFSPEDKEDEPDEGPCKPLPASWAMRIETATGKSHEARKGIVAALRSGLTVAFAAPRHALLDEGATALRAMGADVRVYRGYTAPDPDFPDVAMCLDPAAVQDAQDAAARSVRESVCERMVEGKKLFCAFHDRCGMTRQRAATAAVWMIPHALLFQAKPEYIPQPDAIVIDENITMEALPDKPARMTVDAIDNAEFMLPADRVAFNLASGDLQQSRANLCRALRDHPKEGPLQRSILLRHRITAADAGSAIQMEWQRLRESNIEPGMPPGARKALVAVVGAHNRELKALAAIWKELRTFLSGEAETSGRLYLRYDEEAGCRVLERRSLDVVRSSWSAPCLCLDATLPPVELIAPVIGHPVEVKADIAACWSPHGRVRQIVGAPVTKTKLGIAPGREPETPRRSVTGLLRLIRLRAALTGRGRIVVAIGPKRLVEKFKELGLPPNVECGHFGAIAGIDRWHRAAGLVVIGQDQPGPLVVEALAGIIIGTMPETLPGPTEKGERPWFPQKGGGIRLATGEGARVRHCYHPDPVVEALRWQITEAGLIQAIGRLRALRRTPDNPYFLDIVNDLPLPLTVDTVEAWEAAKPGTWANMAPEGLLMESATDIMACFPELAPTHKTARELSFPTFALTPVYLSHLGVRATLRRARYKRLGRYRPAAALLLPNAPADLKSWLTDRLGAIEWLEIENIEKPDRGSTEHPSSAGARPTPNRSPFPRAVDIDPDLAAAYRCAIDIPSDPRPPAPVKAEIVTFDLAAPIRWPAVIAAKLASIPAAEEAAARRSVETRDGRGRRAPASREVNA